jgi:phosphoribosylformylglycinamidine cyclo-ligase
LPIFKLLQARGNVPEDELYQVFNMGIGMTVIVAAKRAGEVLAFMRAQKQKAWLIGQVVGGSGKVKF